MASKEIFQLIFLLLTKKKSIGRNCKYCLQLLYKVSLQINSRPSLEISQLNFFPVKWSLDREVMKAVLRKYQFLIMMAFGLLCYHIAIRMILSWHVPKFFWATLYGHIECKMPSSSFHVTSDSNYYFRWLLSLRRRATWNKTT